MITGINHVTLAVSDLGRSFAFYTEVLGLKAVARWARGAYLTAGRDWICLSCDGNTLPERGDGYTHIAFSVEPQAFAECSRFVRSQGAEIWQENHSEGDSLYFLDPDGHRLEIHVGDLESRLASMEKAPYDDLELFD